ncbi:MAG: Rid family hydrolase [Candidatus Phosphoribacter sp.]
MRQIITTADAPSSPLYSQGVRAGNNIFVSGLVGIDPSKNSLAGSTIQDQTRQALKNCQAVLAAAGATLDDVVEVGVDIPGVLVSIRMTAVIAWDRSSQSAAWSPVREVRARAQASGVVGKLSRRAV